jgi:hypothetical protein
MCKMAWIISHFTQDTVMHMRIAMPFGFRVRWRVKLSLRESDHLIELRSGSQGHRVPADR